MPKRCNSSGSAVDACHDTTGWARRAERAADSGVVYAPRALSVSPGAPRIYAQRIARFDPYPTRNCLPPRNDVETYSRSIVAWALPVSIPLGTVGHTGNS